MYLAKHIDTFVFYIVSIFLNTEVAQVIELFPHGGSIKELFILPSSPKIMAAASDMLMLA